MTSKMQSRVDHIKTALDVDPWAAEMVEKIFTEYDRRFDKVLEIIEINQGEDDIKNEFDSGFVSACKSIREVMKNETTIHEPRRCCR